MGNKASLTSLMSAFGRAFHTENEKLPVFADEKARLLITDEEYAAIGKYIISGIDFFVPEKKGTFENEKAALSYFINTQIIPTPAARAKFCEESLKTAVKTGTLQYVILGAGLDTFAFREPDLMMKYDVFEVDHPVTQADKIQRINRAKLKIPDKLRYVAVDFTKDDLKEKLITSGFDPTKKTFFSWLGVSYYLSDNEIENFLESVSDLSSEGSTLVFDYADENLFLSDIKRVQKMIAMAAAGGEPMKACFSYKKIEKLLENHGFLIYELMKPQEIQSKYFSGRESELTAFEHINYVAAVNNPNAYS